MSQSLLFGEGKWIRIGGEAYCPDELFVRLWCFCWEEEDCLEVVIVLLLIGIECHPDLKRQQQLQITHLQREPLRLLSQSSPDRNLSPSQIPGRYPPSSTRKKQYQYQTDPPNPSNELLLRKLPNPVNRVTNRSQSGTLVIYLSNQTRLYRTTNDDVNRNTRILLILQEQARQPQKPS